MQVAPVAPPSAPASQRGPQLTGQIPASMPAPSSVTGTGPHPLAGATPVYASQGAIYPTSQQTVITVQYPQVGSTITSPKGSYVVRSVLGPTDS
jgi:hypothetical protein